VRLLLASLPLAALLGSAQVVTQSTEVDAAELARALQRRYDTIKDFSADFVHVYRGGILKREATERGRLLVKKPGKMRWEYTTPEEKLFVADGIKLYTYIPQDRQVVISSLPRDDQATTPALFLAGKGNLTRDFVPSFADPPAGVPPGTRALKLVPNTPQPEYESIVLAVDSQSLALRGLMTIDPQGGASTFTFANLRENVGIPDKSFVFAIPRGADVVSDSPR
jgi:outer membrane lipoprotein carrier protein